VPAALTGRAFGTVCTQVGALGSHGIAGFVEWAFNAITRAETESFRSITKQPFHETFVTGTGVTTLTLKTNLFTGTGVALIGFIVTVIIDPVTGLLTDIVAATTRTDQVLVNGLITVIIQPITHFLCRTEIGNTYDHAIDALSCTLGTNPCLACRTRTGRYRAGAVRPFIYAFITVIIEPITQIDHTVRCTHIGVAGIANTIPIFIQLVRVW
jgi:hypothetical protein